MNRKVFAGLLGLGVWLICAGAFAANTVVIPSQTFNGGETGVEIRALLTNDVTCRTVAVPFVFRNVQGGAFITSLKIGYAERLDVSTGVLSEINITNTYDTEDGSCKGGAPGGFGTAVFSDTLPHPVSSSPVAFLLFRSKIFSDTLGTGADAVGSIRMVVDLNANQGQFIVDTTCADPANHLLFVDGSTNTPIPPVFTMGVFNIGHPPIARDTSWSTDENVAKSVAYLPASDADSDPLTFSINSGPEHGSISGFNTSTGAFTYTPDPGYSGPDSLKYEATDGDFVSNEGTVRITVIDVNDPPVARDTTVTTDEDTPVNGQMHATDTDGPGPLTFEHLNGPTHGTLTSFDVNTGAFTYAPALNYNGNDQFTFRVNDGLNNSAPGIVSIVINPVNDPPVARDTTLAAPFETTVSGKLPASDVDGPSLTYNIVAGPFNGTVSGLVPSTGVYNYTPGTGYSGPDSILFTATDGIVPSNMAVVRINVSASSCVCANWSDLFPDGSPNPIDLNVMIDVLFYNSLPTISPHCPTFDADLNCDCYLDALDFNEMINYIFFNGSYPCDPCQATCFPLSPE